MHSKRECTAVKMNVKTRLILYTDLIIGEQWFCQFYYSYCRRTVRWGIDGRLLRAFYHLSQPSLFPLNIVSLEMLV